MTTLEKVREMLPTMLPSEKAQVLQWLARDIGGAFPGIESTPTVMGGNRVLSVRVFQFGDWCRQESWEVVKLIC